MGYSNSHVVEIEAFDGMVVPVDGNGTVEAGISFSVIFLSFATNDCCECQLVQAKGQKRHDRTYSCGGSSCGH